MNQRRRLLLDRVSLRFAQISPTRDLIARKPAVPTPCTDASETTTLEHSKIGSGILRWSSGRRIRHDGPAVAHCPTITVVASIDDAVAGARPVPLARAIELVQTPAAALPRSPAPPPTSSRTHRFRRARPSNCESPVISHPFRSRLSDAQPQICPAYPAQVAGLHHHFIAHPGAGHRCQLVDVLA